MFDLKQSFGTNYELPVVNGHAVSKEGLALVKVMEDGIAKVRVANGTSGEVFVGFSSSDNQRVTDEPRVESVSVPTAGTYTVQLSSTIPFSVTGGTTSLSFEISVYDNTAAAYLVHASATGIIAGRYALNVSGPGSLTFNAAQAGHDVVVYWRVNLTAQEAATKYYERSINNKSNAYFNTIGVLCGQGKIYTYEYDTAANWSTAEAGCAWAGADGKLYATSATNARANAGQLIKLPSADSVTLGVAFNVFNI